MQRADSFEKTLMLGKIGGRRRRGRQRMRWLDGITDSTDMSLGLLATHALPSPRGERRKSSPLYQRTGILFLVPLPFPMPTLTHLAEPLAAEEHCYFYFSVRGSQITDYIPMR